MMSFNYGLIILRYFSTGSVLIVLPLHYIQYNVIPKITYFHCSITIFFFFILKKISNISKYSIFNFFIIFLNPKQFFISPCSKRFLRSIFILCVIPLFSISSLNRFVIGLIVASVVFFFFSFFQSKQISYIFNYVFFFKP